MQMNNPLCDLAQSVCIVDCVCVCTQSALGEKGMEALDLRVPFDEKATLERNINYLVRSLDVSIDSYVQLCLYIQ